MRMKDRVAMHKRMSDEQVAKPIIRDCIRSGMTVKEIKDRLKLLGIPASRYDSLREKGYIEKWRQKRIAVCTKCGHEHTMKPGEVINRDGVEAVCGVRIKRPGMWDDHCGGSLRWKK